MKKEQGDESDAAREYPQGEAVELEYQQQCTITPRGEFFSSFDF